MTVIWTEGAAQDLTAIVDYIAGDDPQAARRVAKAVFDGVMSLSSMPHRGRGRPTDSSREMVFAPWPYLAVYEVVDSKVYIKGIRHTSRDWSDSN